ncbi:FaeA/PapI family transcriptional regulator [Serratia proteamaculans]|jgi:DNA-binding MarR family transcriptional regulator|uniref:FaeA/PapI family transcriptional regulator n=1 Tax=Serratia proteamaculans TaxID=28151 RepID=UPI00217B7D7A|nr:FaeA/PapI family transcriptional regulator [Serratia proteamaculans]CAI0855366.1 FaeA-like protein [Serratia proteamaculans]CAI1114382.1 FaeA-like protein [Serratia proteamaculans]CAI1211437.1 FaeA-like protein [Serratia proteamaculans]CAI1612473.1 FaeA-like protein [Serratia proteamaculans]
MIDTQEPGLSRNTKAIFSAIVKLCASREDAHSLSPESWPSTREIAEDCNFSIYKARYLLLRLEKKGWVKVTPTPIKNSLRWYICGQ